MLDRYKSGYSEALRAWKEGPIKDTDLCPECYKLYSETMTKFWRAENNG
nr:MAG TPA: hypothetical protein [Caudoviricetes sp.]